MNRKWIKFSINSGDGHVRKLEYETVQRKLLRIHNMKRTREHFLRLFGKWTICGIFIFKKSRDSHEFLLEISCDVSSILVLIRPLRIVGHQRSGRTFMMELSPSQIVFFENKRLYEDAHCIIPIFFHWLNVGGSIRFLHLIAFDMKKIWMNVKVGMDDL